VTEDPEVVALKQVLVEVGFDQIWGQRYQASGLEGTLLRWPTFGFSAGVGIAEIQLDGAFFQVLLVKQRFDAPLSGVVAIDGNLARSVGDFTVGTKVRVLSEAPGRPAIGLRFATKLPMARNERGLGLDTTDFHAQVLVAKTVQSVRIVGNAGLGILGDVTRGDRQNDVLTYGLSVARALTQAAEVVGEVNGRLHTGANDPPPGTQSSSILRGGLRYTAGRVRFDAGALVGILAEDPKFGVTAGLTWVIGG
jgi:hypothetical protein